MEGYNGYLDNLTHNSLGSTYKKEDGFFESTRLYPYFGWVSQKATARIEPKLLSPTPGSMGEVLMNIETNDSPDDFKEDVLRLAQIYFDDLFESKRPYESEERAISEEVLNIVSLAVCGFYQGDIPFEEVRDCIRPHKKSLSACQSKYKRRHLQNQELKVKSFTKSVRRSLKKKEIELIIPIASGGFEPAVLCANYLDLPEVLPVRYSRYSRSDNSVLLSPQTTDDYLKEMLYKKVVLIVDDIIGGGQTISKVKGWSDKYNPKKIYFAVVQSHGVNLEECCLYKRPKAKYLYQSKP